MACAKVVGVRVKMCDQPPYPTIVYFEAITKSILLLE